MPWSPSERYRGDEYLYGAITGLGDDLKKGLERYKQLKQDRQLADESIGHLARNPETAKYLMTDKDKTIADALARYEKAGTSQRVAMSHSAMSNMDVDMKMQQRKAQQEDMAAQAEERRATAEYRKAIAAQTQQATSGEDVQPILSPDGKQWIGLKASKGGVHVFPTPYDVPQPDDQTKQQPQQPGMIDRFKNWWMSQPKADFSQPGRPGIQQQGQVQTPTPQMNIPKPGEVRNGYRFKGGNPADQNSWEKV